MFARRSYHTPVLFWECDETENFRLNRLVVPGCSWRTKEFHFAAVERFSTSKRYDSLLQWRVSRFCSVRYCDENENFPSQLRHQSNDGTMLSIGLIYRNLARKSACIFCWMGLTPLYYCSRTFKVFSKEIRFLRSGKLVSILVRKELPWRAQHYLQ